MLNQSINLELIAPLCQIWYFYVERPRSMMIGASDQ